MKLNIIGRSFGTTVSVAAIAALALAGCGSDNNVPAGSSQSGTASASAEECGGKNSVTAEGSTAQQNAVALFNQVWG
ncbi:phosphate ABC transporter substrate-binding protein PstS, partial [Enterococcus faecium]